MSVTRVIVALTVFSILVECTKFTVDKNLKLIGIARTEFDHLQCSKHVFSTNDSVLLFYVISSYDQLSPSSKKHNLPKITFNDSTYYYLANGRIKKFYSNTQIDSSKQVKGYFSFYKGRNDTIFLYLSIGKEMIAEPESNFYEPTPRIWPRDMRKEVTKDEWERIWIKRRSECVDTIYGIVP